MIYRRFGRTDLKMPVFSCGGMRYQQGWKDIPLSEVEDEVQKNVEATIRRSVELGINHIETARGYGPSERQLGLVLPKFPRDEIIVQTKVAPQADAKQFTADFEDSLGRLNLDYVDLLGLHGLNNRETLDHALQPGGCLEAARKLQAAGKCRWVGFSTHGNVDEITEAIDHPNHGGFDYVNLHWYYIFQRNWAAVEAATKQDMGVFIISPSDKGGKLYDPPAKLVDLTAPLHPMTFNDLYCLAQPTVHTLSIGASQPSDFNEHIDALPFLETLEKANATLAPIVTKLEAAMHDTIGDTLSRPFDLDLPEWEDTPGGVNVSIIVWLLGLAKAWDMTAYGKMRYNLLGPGGHWFPGEKPGDFDEAAILKAVAKSPIADRVPALLREADALLGAEAAKRLSES